MPERQRRARPTWLLLLAVLAGCSPAPQDRLRGTIPTGSTDVSTVTMPEAVPGEADRSFTFRAEPGHLLYVYFGFANCPDICPTTLSDFRKALMLLGPDTARVDLAFITVDPRRDSAEVLVPWVRSFVTSGHALIPRTQEQLGRAETAFNAKSTVNHPIDGPYEVSHTGLGYVVDDRGQIRVQWDFGVKPEVMAHDLRLLLKPGPRVDVGDVWARPSPAGAKVGAMYLTLTSEANDRLVGIDVPNTVAARTELHEAFQAADGQLGMKRVDAVELPAGKPVEFRPGSLHVMLIDLAKPLVALHGFEATLRFQRSTPQVVKVRVIQVTFEPKRS